MLAGLVPFCLPLPCRALWPGEYGLPRGCFTVRKRVAGASKTLKNRHFSGHFKMTRGTPSGSCSGMPTHGNARPTTAQPRHTQVGVGFPLPDLCLFTEIKSPVTPNPPSHAGICPASTSPRQSAKHRSPDVRHTAVEAGSSSS